MIKDTRYEIFSLHAHRENWKIKKYNVCRFELTFKCDLHCRHCYTECYNKETRIKKELTVEGVKLILDKAYKAGCVWLNFTGGDPLTRKDFPEIYAYAKKKGFIITVFTNGYSINDELIHSFKKKPLFSIEITLNSVTENLYEKISGVKGSFVKVMQGIESILEAGLPLKIKTQLTRDNLHELSRIKAFILSLGLSFRPDIDLHARLNGDLAPCNLRLPFKDLLVAAKHIPLPEVNSAVNPDLFRCCIGSGDGLHIDPYGNTFACNLIRNPCYSLLKEEPGKIMENKLLPLIKKWRFSLFSKCKGCKLRPFCLGCPGKACIEAGDLGASIDYYCCLAGKLAKYQNSNAS